MHFRFKLDMNANFTYHNGEWVFISGFSVIISLDAQKLKHVYLLLHNAI